MVDPLVSLLADCHDDPGLFHEAVLGRRPLYPKQEEIARSVICNEVTVVPAAHGVGKSWYAASAVLHWLYTRPRSKVITTGPSNSQLVTVLWGGIKAARSRSLIPLAGVITEGKSTPQRLTLGPDHYAIGFVARKAESFQGQHADGTSGEGSGDLLVVVDESSGVEQPTWDAIESLGYTSLLALGNPIRAGGHFKVLWDQARRGTPGFRGIHLDAFDSPYAHLTDAEVRALGLPKGLTTRTWIDKVRRIYGEQSLYWQTRVLAQFPDRDHDTLIPAEWVDRCLGAERPGHAQVLRSLVVDLAKGTGRDRTVILVADYLGILHLYEDNRTSVQAAAGLVAELARTWGVVPTNIVYDAGGWAGTDMTRYLAALGIRGARQYFGGTPLKSRFSNRRSQAAWRLRQRLDPSRPLRPASASGRGGLGAADPRSVPAQHPFQIPRGAYWGDLREELLELRYVHDGSKLKLESKDDLAARLGRSPDLGDALIMLASLWPGDE